jgi:hypothetical protein
MTTEAASTALARSRVTAYLRAQGLNFSEGPNQSIIVPFENTATWISFSEGNDGTALLFLGSTIVANLEPSPALYRYVATHQPVLGHLSVFTNEDTAEMSIMLNHLILADYLDEPEFTWAMSFLVAEAEELAPKLVPMFGR